MLVWFALVGTVSRLNVATLLSKPGTGTPPEPIAEDTVVLPRSFSELTFGSGVCTAM